MFCNCRENLLGTFVFCNCRENLLGSSDNVLESAGACGGPAANKLHQQATASSFGSDEDSSNEDQVHVHVSNYKYSMCSGVS